MIFSLVIWVLGLALLFLSFSKDREKSLAALKVAWKSFRSMALPVLASLWAIGFLLTFLSPQTIAKMMGHEAGWRGMILSALVGSVVLIQAFVAFPLAGSLLRQGASVGAIAAFVTTLVMVGVMTAPLEIKYYGKKFALWRNALSFFFALIIALLMGAVLG